LLFLSVAAAAAACAFASSQAPKLLQKS